LTLLVFIIIFSFDPRELRWLYISF